MKKLYILLLIAVAWWHPCSSQTVGPPPIVIGSAAGMGSIGAYNASQFIIGQTITTNFNQTWFGFNKTYPPNLPDGNPDSVRLGFPYDANYLHNTFAGGLWCSKGYYGDYILLQWTVANNASNITSFLVSRRAMLSADTSYHLVATLDPSINSWQDIYAESSTMYQYKIVAQGILPVTPKIDFNYITGIGFRQQIGTATGRITYAGGTAVPGVSVIAETTPAIATYAIGFDGVNSHLTIDETSHASLTSASDFTFQSWIYDTTSSKNGNRYIFDKNSTTSLWLNESNKTVNWTYNGLGTISLSYSTMASNYFHLSAIRNGYTLILQLNDGKNVITFSSSLNLINPFCMPVSKRLSIELLFSCCFI